MPSVTIVNTIHSHGDGNSRCSEIQLTRSDARDGPPTDKGRIDEYTTEPAANASLPRVSTAAISSLEEWTASIVKVPVQNYHITALKRTTSGPDAIHGNISHVPKINVEAPLRATDRSIISFPDDPRKLI